MNITTRAQLYLAKQGIWTEQGMESYRSMVNNMHRMGELTEQERDRLI